jgi:adenosine kinase
MTSARYDILGLGNAIVDIIAQVEDTFLAANGLIKGSMALIDHTNADALLAAMGTTVTISGGSAANTVIGAAHLGCTASFVGKVRNDALGALFTTDIKAAGVDFPVPHAETGPSTARCFVLVTPDGERTMNTYLGACQDLSEADVDPETVAASKVIYLEGYLWDPPGAKAAFVKAAKVAHASGRHVALTLSDAFCVGRYRTEFIQLVRDGLIDILFANEAELASLYETDDFDGAVAQLRENGILSVVTRSEKGCVVVTREDIVAVPAEPIAALIDTTGAGDLFAAGFVSGWVRQFDHASCAKLGAVAAAEIIQHIGARPKADLKDLAAARGISL